MRRLGSLLAMLGLAAGVALGAAAPAAAEENAGSCYGPEIRGNATASSTSGYRTLAEYRLKVAELVGTAYGRCIYLSWELRFSRSTGEVGRAASGTTSYNPLTDRTTISFPTQLLDVPSGNGTLKLEILTVEHTVDGRGSAYAQWATRTRCLHVPNKFDTETGLNTSTWC